MIIDHPEVGRELKPSDLKLESIVWVTKEGRNALATMWVVGVSNDCVRLYAGEIGTELILSREGDRLRDDTAQMHLYEYLGDS